MSADVLLGELNHLALAFVGQHLVRLFERQPHAASHFDSHVLSDIADAATAIPEEVEADDLEDTFASAPGARINVSYVGELRYPINFESGLLLNLALGSFFGFFALIDRSLGQRQHARFFARRRRRIVAIVIDGVGLDYRYMPSPADTAQHYATGGNFSDRLCLGGHARKPKFRVKLYVRRLRARSQRCVAVENTEE